LELERWMESGLMGLGLGKCTLASLHSESEMVESGWGSCSGHSWLGLDLVKDTSLVGLRLLDLG
jgi:hypothetical protein